MIKKSILTVIAISIITANGYAAQDEISNNQVKKIIEKAGLYFFNKRMYLIKSDEIAESETGKALTEIVSVRNLTMGETLLRYSPFDPRNDIAKSNLYAGHVNRAIVLKNNEKNSSEIVTCYAYIAYSKIDLNNQSQVLADINLHDCNSTDINLNASLEFTLRREEISLIAYQQK